MSLSVRRVGILSAVGVLKLFQRRDRTGPNRCGDSLISVSGKLGTLVPDRGIGNRSTGKVVVIETAAMC